MLTQPQKDAVLHDVDQTIADVTAFDSTVPERSSLLSQTNALKTAVQAAVVPPPAPTQPLDPLLVFDVPLNQGSSGSIGATTSDYLYTPYFPWVHKGGDWTDAEGTAQGNTPFASTAIALGASGVVTLEGLSFIKQGEQPQILLRGRATGGSSPSFLFNSRESTVGPTLTYAYADGTTEVVSSVADTALNVSTAVELGAQPTWTVSPTIRVLLRFPAPSKAVSGTLLTLSLIHVYDAAGVIEAYDGTIRLPAVVPTNYQLKGDSRVFFETQCFEDAPGYMKALLFGDPAHSFALDTYNQRSIVVDETGSKVLQITFDPAVNRGATTSILFPNQDEADEAAVEFEIRFLPDMETGMTQGFKCAFGWSSATKGDDAYFAGIWGIKKGRTGTLLAGNGGAKSHGYDGWSLRFDAFRPVTPASHPIYQHVAPMQYVYWPGQTDYYGDPWPWNLAQFTPKLNEWHRITHRLKVNSVNTDGTYNKDAEFDGYIDGQLAVQKRGFYLRTTLSPLIAQPVTSTTPWAGVDSKLAIGRSWFNVYHGGTAFPAHRCSFQVRNVRAAKFA